MNGTKITNVADGSADSDAVNFKQLSAVSEEAKNKGSWTLNAGESANVIGDGDSITIAEGSNLKITAEGGTYTFGVVDNPEFASVKIGDYTISHNNGLDMGGAVLDNVAAGSIASGSMQAVNGGQLFTTNTNLSNLGGSVASAFGGACGIMKTARCPASSRTTEAGRRCRALSTASAPSSTSFRRAGILKRMTAAHPARPEPARASRR